MSGNVYTASVQAVAVTLAQDLIELLAPADAVVEILSVAIGQSTDVGDSAEEILRTSFRRVTGAPTSGSGGSTPTPRPHHGGSAAAGSTVEANNTTQISGGTNVAIETLLWNVRVPEEKVWIPESRIYISPSTYFVWELEAAPADSITVDLSITFRELGG